MRYIFSPQGEAALSRFIRPDTLLAFDFDSTLAPIVPCPTRRGPQPPSAWPCAACARLPASRSSPAARSPTSANGWTSRPSTSSATTAPKDCRTRTGRRIDRRCGGLDTPDRRRPRPVPPPGISVEDKGHSLSLHYRTAPDREAAKQAIDALVPTLSPAPRVIGGKCVVNLLPKNAADKFDALLALQRHEGAGNALFIGDDETDENVFRRALPDWLTIRVGHETPSAAAYCLNSQNEMASLIQRIDGMIRARKKESA